MWGAIITGVAGAAGGYLQNKAEQRKADAAMAGAAKYKDGVDRLYGTEQDALIAELQRRGADESRARAAVAGSEMNRQLLERQSTGGALGVRGAMMSGGEAQLAGQVGEASANEVIGSRSGASSNLSQAQQDAMARNQARLDALRLYNQAKDNRKSGLRAAFEGGASGLMAYSGVK